MIYSAAAIGVSFIQYANTNSLRNIYVLGVSLFLGISIPQYFTMHTDGSGHGPLRTSAGWVSSILLVFFVPLSPLLNVCCCRNNFYELRDSVIRREGSEWSAKVSTVTDKITNLRNSGSGAGFSTHPESCGKRLSKPKTDSTMLPLGVPFQDFSLDFTEGNCKIF